MRNIDLIRKVTLTASGQWPVVLASLNINVPDSPRQHAACPACGGKDRFRFDNNGRGSFICNQCGAGDGLDLIQRVNNCDATEAARMAADVLGIDCHATASQKREQLDAEHRQRDRERQQQSVAEEKQRRQQFTTKYQALADKAAPGQSAYLTSKGLQCHFPLLSDGSMLITLMNVAGVITGAQVIKPDGSKRLVAGTVKKGSFFVLGNVDAPDVVLIGEGLATVISCQHMRPDALAVAAIDAGNLPAVALALRQRYPDVQIIIAADNDQNGESDRSGGLKVNTGRDAAEKAAKAVTGWVSIPPVDYKADWNDYHQQYGLEAATAAFNA
ncbi:primase-helicase zinc-binding domain-containing protein, partial [Serratia liquefaciens]|uniref:primase-helicase zinc-binding domain-containing protein n=1 Tax=Serratia liquefaciens TaxID=614 RepID=UPI003905E445